jgi:hypothetical protein
VLCGHQDTAFMHLLCFVLSDTCFGFGGLAPLPVHALSGDCNDTVAFGKHCSMRCEAGYKLEGKQFNCSQDTGRFQADPHDPQTCTGSTCIACLSVCRHCECCCRDPCCQVPEANTAIQAFEWRAGLLRCWRGLSRGDLRLCLLPGIFPAGRDQMSAQS